MTIRKRVGNMIPRIVVLAFLIIWETGIVVCALDVLLGDRRNIGALIILILHQLVLPFVAMAGMIATETVTLTPEGVVRRPFYKKRIYRWSDIQQAGILLCKGRGYQYWALVLVPINGVPHTRQDASHTFRIKSINKNLIFPDSPEARRSIEEYYGPLDFGAPKG